MEKRSIHFDPAARPVHKHLDEMVDFLLENGNALATDFKWGEDRTGFYCHLRQSINFDLLEDHFEIPDFISLDREGDVIECNRSWVTIRGGMRDHH